VDCGFFWDSWLVCGLRIVFFSGTPGGTPDLPAKSPRKNHNPQTTNQPRVPEKNTIHKPQTSQESQKKTQSTNHKPSPDIRKESLSKAIKSLRKPIKSLWKPIGPGNKVLRIDHTNLRGFVYYRDHGPRRLRMGCPIGPHRAPWDPTIMGPYKI